MRFLGGDVNETAIYENDLVEIIDSGDVGPAVGVLKGNIIVALSNGAYQAHVKSCDLRLYRHAQNPKLLVQG